VDAELALDEAFAPYLADGLHFETPHDCSRQVVVHLVNATIGMPGRCSAAQANAARPISVA